MPTNMKQPAAAAVRPETPAVKTFYLGFRKDKQNGALFPLCFLSRLVRVLDRLLDGVRRQGRPPGEPGHEGV
jgi:hypothetical protein